MTRLKLHQHSCTDVADHVCKVPTAASEGKQQATPTQNTVFLLTLTTPLTAQETWLMSSTAVMFHPAITEQTLSPVLFSLASERGAVAGGKGGDSHD